MAHVNRSFRLLIAGTASGGRPPHACLKSDHERTFAPLASFPESSQSRIESVAKETGNQIASVGLIHICDSPAPAVSDPPASEAD